MMYLAKELHKSLEELMEMSTLEFSMWAAFYQHEGKKQKSRMRQNGRHKHSR